MKDGCLEAHLRWQQRVFARECETRAEETSYVKGLCQYIHARDSGTWLAHSPAPRLRTSIELCVVVNHEHDFPLEYVVVDETTADAGYALVVLHLLELPSQ